MPSSAYKMTRDKIAALKKQARDEMKDSFEQESLSILYLLEVSSFSWDQYTPYFNDGDACVFSVYADDPKINGADYYSPDEADPPLPEDFPVRPTITSWEEIKALSPEDRADYDAQHLQSMSPWNTVADFIKQWEEEDLEFMFGDHVRVTVTKKGILTEERQHD